MVRVQILISFAGLARLSGSPEGMLEQAASPSETNRVDIWRPRGLDSVELHSGTGVTIEYPRHWHDELYLCAVTSGTSRLDVRGESLATAAGHIGIVPAGEVHANWKAGCSFRCIFISEDRLRSAIEGFLERCTPTQEFRSGAVADAQASAAFVQTHRSLENPSSELERDSLLFGFFHGFMERHSNRQAETPKVFAEDKAVERARSFLDERYAEPVSLAELAQLTGLSPFHLNRSFSRCLGMPPHAYQLQLRLKRAKAVLREGSSVAEAASLAGFFDQSHFTHHFKRSERMTPRQYQRLRKDVQDNRPHTTYFGCS